MHAHHGYGMEGPHMGFLAKQLNLTDDQKAQMKAVWRKRSSDEAAVPAGAPDRSAASPAYVEGPYDEDKVQPWPRRKPRSRSQMTVAETRIHNQMYQLLTPDQQAN